MSSRYLKALVKAENVYDAALTEAKKANDEYIGALQDVEKCRLDFVQKNPDKRWGYWDDATYKKLSKIANAYYSNSNELKLKALKLKGVMDLKDRQLIDYLARCPRNCVCKGPDTGAMVQCDGCKNWFHLSCVKLTEEEAQALSRYDCLMCVRMAVTQAVTQAETQAVTQAVTPDVTQAVTQSESPVPSSPPNTPEVEAPHSQSVCTLS
jgi:hypothetical protein